MMGDEYARMMMAMIYDIFLGFYDGCKMEKSFCIFGFINGRKWQGGKSGWKGVSYD